MSEMPEYPHGREYLTAVHEIGHDYGPVFCGACHKHERDQLREEVKIKEVCIAAQKAELEGFKNLYRVCAEEVALHKQESDHWKSVAGKLAKQMEVINKVGLDRELGQIVGSEHYEKAWLDCVELAGRGIAQYNASRGDEGEGSHDNN